MGTHRQKPHYRRMVFAAVAIAAVGIPSVAVTCADWRDSGARQSHSAEKTVAEDRWDEPDRYHQWNADRAGEPTALASKTPSASASTATATSARPTAPAPERKTTALKHWTTPSDPTPRAAASATPTPPSTPKPTATAPRAVARVVELVNAERGKVGCSPLTLNATLTKAAQDHSADMAAHQNMSHTGSDGSSPADRITRAGYTWSAYGENVAYGYATPEQVMAVWMSSAGHKANILNCAFKEIGVGIAQPNSYWTQDFATAG